MPDASPPIEPKQLLQLISVTSVHEYDTDDRFEQILDDLDIQQDAGSHLHINVPVHTSGTVVSNETEPAYTEAEVTAFDDKFDIRLPHAPSKDWAINAHKNIIAYLNGEHDVLPAGNELTIAYDYGIPHPVFTLDDLQYLIPEDTLTDPPSHPDYEPEQTIVGYDLPNATIHGALDTDTIHIETGDKTHDEDIIKSLSETLRTALKTRLDERDPPLDTPHDNIYASDMLAPVLYRAPREVFDFWNAIADHLFNRDLVNEPTPAIRTVCESLDIEGHPASLIFLRLMATLEHELPTLDSTIDMFAECNVFESENQEEWYVNWRTGIQSYHHNRLNLKMSISDDICDYPKSALTEGELIQIHAFDAHMQLAATPVWYGPVFALGEAQAHETDRYFWVECGWRLEIHAARPCASDDTETFDEELVHEYFEQRGGPFTDTTKQNIKNSESLTHEEMENTMLLLDDHHQATEHDHDHDQHNH